ncbi:MAG: hypothetical protein DWG76_04495 [Chloroflexi bacterium]|nr:hypothetical protein [Chloroflexota bacterium]
MDKKPLIGVVGPCKSGKSTLIRGLQAAGYNAKQIAQEHSFAPRMWQQLTNPDALIYLHCEYPVTVERGLNWREADYLTQQPRIAHAREHADFEIATDVEEPGVVLEKVLAFLRDGGY